MTLNKNLLTVVLLTYNHEKTIATAFDSILEQKTNFYFDIHVLEDCSTDGTSDICKKYEQRYPDKIKLFLNENNLGVTENLKQGLLKIKSKYFAFLEGDDYWCNENKLQKQLFAMEQNPDCTLCGHNTLVKDISKNKEWFFIGKSMPSIKEKYTIQDDFRIHPSSRVYRNIIDLTNVPLHIVFDTHIYLLYLSKGNLFYIDEIMSVHHKTPSGFWAGKREKDKKLMALELRYKTNKYFNFTYDFKFFPHSKLLKAMKLFLGTKAGWFLYYHIEKKRIKIKYLILNGPQKQ